jgi:hypothetical protein
MPGLEDGGVSASCPCGVKVRERYPSMVSGGNTSPCNQTCSCRASYTHLAERKPSPANGRNDPMGRGVNGYIMR